MKKKVQENEIDDIVAQHLEDVANGKGFGKRNDYKSPTETIITTVKTLLDLNGAGIHDPKKKASPSRRKIGVINYDPSYQRDASRSLAWKSKLLNVILKGDKIGILSFCHRDGISAVADGRGRLTTIRDFINNEFKIFRVTRKDTEDIERLVETEINDYIGKTFSELDQEVKDRILNYPLMINFYDVFTEEQEYEIFCDLNTTAIPIPEAHRVYAETHMSEFGKTLEEILVGKEQNGKIIESVHIENVKYLLNYKRMRNKKNNKIDKNLVANRYCVLAGYMALCDDFVSNVGDAGIRNFLNKMKKMKKTEIEAFIRRFFKAVDTYKSLVENYSFLKRKNSKLGPPFLFSAKSQVRSVIISVLFNADIVEHKRIIKNREELVGKKGSGLRKIFDCVYDKFGVCYHSTDYVNITIGTNNEDNRKATVGAIKKAMGLRS